MDYRTHTVFEMIGPSTVAMSIHHLAGKMGFMCSAGLSSRLREFFYFENWQKQPYDKSYRGRGPETSVFHIALKLAKQALPWRRNKVG